MLNFGQRQPTSRVEVHFAPVEPLLVGSVRQVAHILFFQIDAGLWGLFLLFYVMEFFKSGRHREGGKSVGSCGLHHIIL